MAWCEAQQSKVYYCLGLARNSRLRDLLDQKFARVRELAILCGGVARGFTEFQYQTQKSWTLSRRVIGKAEVLGDKDNPRFIVTNLPAEGFDDDQQSPDRFCAQKCYEDFIARAATWKTSSSSSIWIWTPIAPAPTGWPAISYGCGLALLLSCSSRDCVPWPCRAPNWLRRLPARSGNDY